ncbi:TonB family protein [Arcticibacter sp. MXS-1]|uniref:TonB family protein n=1 Tax=Arcticibacter sp. MXS-1 TaxID=3341726 RepID=UPI0035A8D15F
MQTFISQNLIYPGYSRQNCIQGTIEVSFRLGTNGQVYGSRVEKGLGVDLDDEALRIVRLSSGKWLVPAGFDTTSIMTMPVTFSLSDRGCLTQSPKDIRNAINAYRAQQELTAAITNFYSQKEKGKYTEDDEKKIMQLKEQLGYNEEYIDEVIQQAQKKLRQGDKEGACEDLRFVKKLGSSKADRLIESSCN